MPAKKSTTATKPATARRAISQRAQDLFEAKLATSGLDLDDASTLNMSVLDTGMAQELHKSFKPVVAMRIPYHDILGNPLSDWPGCPPFYRLRYLEQPQGFEEQARGKQQRYTQEPNTAPVAYYPRNENWAEIAVDVGIPIILTEGELKAAKACKEGFPTIGLGGVYNWRSHKLGLEWLPSLDLVLWARRCVYICFDSDLSTNVMIAHALRELAEALVQRGAFVYLVLLPTLEDLDKVGLDDFLVHAGPNAVDQLHQLLHEAEPLGLSSVLFSLNDKYTYIQSPGLIFNTVTKQKLPPGAFKEHAEAAKRYQERQLKPDGSISYKPVSAAAAWLSWPLRKEAEALTYQPGAGALVDSPTGGSRLNLWPGWGCEAVPGNHKPFIELLEHLFQGAEPEALKWFLQWCAYPLQHPGTKLYSSAVIYGIRHGTGKSLIGYTLANIYGQNFTEITQQDLHGSFNEWAESKQFVMGDDVTGSDKRQEADFLKKLITQRELRVNAKYVPTYVVPDCINYYFTSNQPDAFFLEDDDRRFFIHEVVAPPLSEAFYQMYDQWLKAGGASHVFDYLLKLDLTGFNPAARALKTHAKERMIADGQSDLGAWVRNLLATPDAVLMVGGVKLKPDLYTGKELLALYDPEGRTRTTANGLGRELRRAGVLQALQGAPLRLADGTQGRYYIIRHVDRWANATAAELAQHLRGDVAKGRAPSKKVAKY